MKANSTERIEPNSQKRPSRTRNRGASRFKIPFGFGKRITVPKTAQDTVPFMEAYDNGVFLVAPDTYSLVFSFGNIDYNSMRDYEREIVYKNYQRLLNAIPSDITFQEFVMNKKPNSDKFRETLTPKTRDYAKHRGEYMQLVESFLAKGDEGDCEKLNLGVLTYTLKSRMDDVNILFKFYSEMQKYYADLKSETKILMPEEVFEILYSFYHPFDDVPFLLPKNMYAKGGRIKDYIVPASFAFRAKDFQMGAAYSRILFVKNFGAQLDDGFLRGLLDTNARVTVSKYLRRVDKGTAMDVVNKNIGNVQGVVQNKMEKNTKAGVNFIKYEDRKRLEELEDVQKRLGSGNTELFEFCLLICISAPTMRELDECHMLLTQKAQAFSVALDVLMFQQDFGLASVVPLGYNMFGRQKNNRIDDCQLSDVMGALMPFTNAAYYAKTGILYGSNKNTGATVIVDRTDEMNANGFVLGSSGSGKSMFVKSELISVLFSYPSDEVIVIDPEGEYTVLSKAFDGEVFKLAAGSRTTFNLFGIDLNYSEEGVGAVALKTDFIMTVVETIKGSQLSATERPILERSVRKVYEPLIESGGDSDYLPTLDDFHSLLAKSPEPEAQNLALMLALYTSKSSFNIFAGHTNFDAKKRFLVVDISAMGEQLHAVGLQVILEFVWQRVLANRKRGIRTWVWVDEFAMMFNDGDERNTQLSGAFFQKVFKRIRKHGGVATAITQNITEVLESKQAKLMLSNAEFCVLLQQKKVDLDTVNGIFELSDGQSAHLSTGQKGSGLIVCGTAIIPFEKPLPTDNGIYKLCTTKFGDETEIAT